MTDWSQLPHDILHKIATCIISAEDFLSFSAVCTSWRSIYLENQWTQPPQAPFLMFCENENISTRTSISLYTSRVYKSHLPEALGRHFCGSSSSGWIVTVGIDFKICLLNPFTRASIDLPPKSTLHIPFGGILEWHEIIMKAFVFKHPRGPHGNESGLLVMIIYGPLCGLAFCRPGDRSWGVVRVKDHVNNNNNNNNPPNNDNYLNCGFIDVSCFGDHIFAVSNMGFLFRVDAHGPDLVSVQFVCPGMLALPMWDWDVLALVESSEGLWMVHQNRDGNDRSIEFVVYSHDFDEMCWVRLSSLGDHAIFFGDNCCFCIREPGRFGCKSNCIYFVGKEKERRWPGREVLADVGVYTVADGRVEPLLCGTDRRRYYSFPIWVVPTFVKG